MFKSKSQIQSNKLYVNIKAIQSTIFQADGTTKVDWVTLTGPRGQQSTAGAAVLRDMGKTVYLPATSGASQSTILRKIQLVPTGGVGTGASTLTSAPGAANEYYTGYISLGGETFGGGDGVPSGVARLN